MLRDTHTGDPGETLSEREDLVKEVGKNPQSSQHRSTQGRGTEDPGARLSAALELPL